jgi:hypothetical protein
MPRVFKWNKNPLLKNKGKIKDDWLYERALFKTSPLLHDKIKTHNRNRTVVFLNNLTSLSKIIG